MGLEETLVQLVTMAIGAGLGSFFMWVVVGPFILKKSAPKMFKGIAKDLFDVSDAELEAADGSMVKAISAKQAQGLYGALGNIVQSAPTEELDALARQYGFADAKDGASKLIGPGGPNLVGQFAQNPGGLAALAGQVGAGGKNPFGGVIQLITALSAISQMGGAGGFGGGDGGGLPPMRALGDGGGSTGARSYSARPGQAPIQLMR